jgi:hypothetical protein
LGSISHVFLSAQFSFSKSGHSVPIGEARLQFLYPVSEMALQTSLMKFAKFIISHINPKGEFISVGTFLYYF